LQRSLNSASFSVLREPLMIMRCRRSNSCIFREHSRNNQCAHSGKIQCTFREPLVIMRCMRSNSYSFRKHSGNIQCANSGNIQCTFREPLMIMRCRRSNSCILSPSAIGTSVEPRKYTFALQVHVW
jgi:ribosomal protein S27E